MQYQQIVMRSLASILPAVRNPRTHSKKQVRKIADSIQRFGFITPILIDSDGRILAGHGRWQAASLVGLTEVPTLRIDHLNRAEQRAYAIADNELAAQAGWDRELLALELAEIEFEMPSLDIAVTGFEIEQIQILRDVAGAKKTPAEPEFEIGAGPTTTRLGDLWLIGDGKSLCGDAVNSADYEVLLAGEVADLVITDPPFNVPVGGHVTSQSSHREFVMASGEMSREQFQRFLSQACRCLVRFSQVGSLHYIFMDWRSISDLIAVGEQFYEELINLIVWVKPQGGMGSLYRSRHELIALFKNGDAPHTNNVALGANGRNRTNVWEYPGVGGFGFDRKLGSLHPTVKNRKMIEDAIYDGSRPGDIVLDPFAGSGTTLLAAHRTGRRGRVIELDPLYCDVCVQRAWTEGLTATLAATGQTYEEVQAERAREHV